MHRRLLAWAPLVVSTHAIASALLAVWIQSHATFAILHRSLEFGTDWVGPWWSVMSVPLLAIVIESVRNRGAAYLKRVQLVNRLIVVCQGLLLLASIVLIVWNR